MKKIAAKYLLERGASADPDNMKEADIVDEIELTTSRTLSKTKKTAMSKLVKEISSLCSIHKVNFKYLKMHEFGAGADLSAKVGIVLSVSL